MNQQEPGHKQRTRIADADPELLEAQYLKCKESGTQGQVRQLLAYCLTATDVWGLKEKWPVQPTGKKGARRRNLKGALDGPARALLYQFACETALRAGSMRSLRVEQVTISRNEHGTVMGGTVRTTSGQQKNKVAHEVPIRAPLAALMAEQIAGKAPKARALAVPNNPAAMLREDLFRAGLPMIDEAGLPLKFHSFRVSAATWVGDATGSDKSVQALTGHLTRSTAAHYNRTSKATQREAVESLPQLRETGTACSVDPPLPLAQTRQRRCAIPRRITKALAQEWP